MNELVLARWTHVTSDDAPHIVLPDGCRDLVHREFADGTSRWTMSPLMDGATSVPCRRGTRLTGYRLRAGTSVDEVALLSRLSAVRHDDAVGLIETYCRPGDEALVALAASRNVRDAARHLGVGVRTLERHVGSATGRPPTWWRSLARARSAASRLEATSSLAALADDTGFSDQSHLSREFVRWFGLSPARLRRRADLLEQLVAAGYGGETAVQISIRNPESSRT